MSPSGKGTPYVQEQAPVQVLLVPSHAGSESVTAPFNETLPCDFGVVSGAPMPLRFAPGIWRFRLSI